MAGTRRTLDLSLPEQKLASLSFADANPKALKEWASHLPMANIGESSRRLYHAIIELNQLIISPQQRLQMLEVVRQPIHFICQELGRHFLGHSISLPEKQRKIANLAQALQLHLAGGYKTVLTELEQPGQPGQEPPACWRNAATGSSPIWALPFCAHANSTAPALPGPGWSVIRSSAMPMSTTDRPDSAG